MENLRSAGISDIGRVRGENQDAILADDRLGLWLVADGMGGHAGGACASSIARDTVRQQVADGAALPDAVMAAHYAVRAEQRGNPERSDMGTTIVAARERQSACEICWVGDSRAYCYSPARQALELLTNDHNVAGMLVASGALSPTEAARHPQRHVLTDCVGLVGEDEPRVGVLNRQWERGETLLLCSDGLTGEVDEEQIVGVLESNESLDAKARALLDSALSAGARDNVSLVLISAPETHTPSPARWRWPFGRKSGY